MLPSDLKQKTAVVIVTHNSEKELESCLQSLAGQTVPVHVYIVDSGSEDARYLLEAGHLQNVTVLQQSGNIGFSRGNNVGYGHIQEDTDFILFINPDTMLDTSFIEQAEKVMEQEPVVGVLTGRLLGYNYAMEKPTGRIDSTGIFRKWYGRWYDRAQGEKNRQQYLVEENIPAVCGALMFCRKTALKMASLSEGVVFDPDFFLYKEDIELSIRIRRAGWSIRYVAYLTAFHGRGWHNDRKRMSRDVRLTAARNEIMLYRKHPSPYMLWAFAKYMLVLIFNI